MNKHSIPYFISLTMPLFWVFAADQSEIQSFQDVEGHVYRTVSIGDQIWMAENLQTEHTPAGDRLGGVFAYEKDERHVDVYGRLYTHEAALKACPPGWCLPSREDFDALFAQLVRQQPPPGEGNWAQSNVGLLMKQSGSACWQPSPYEGTNTAGFSMLPAGFREEVSGESLFSDMGQSGILWGAALGTDDKAWAVQCAFNRAGVKSGYQPRDMALSVRYFRHIEDHVS